MQYTPLPLGRRGMDDDRLYCSGRRPILKTEVGHDVVKERE